MKLVSLCACAFAATFLVGCGGPPYMPARDVPPPPAAPAGVEHGSDTFTSVGNVTIFEQWWRPPGGTRAVLVVVHGLKDHSSRYAELAAHLVERGIAVYAMDLRGHAHSSGVRVGVDSFEDYLVDLDALVAHARAHEPGAPVFLFGHSMGGAIATLWTIERQPKLSGMVLSGAALVVNVSGFKVFGTNLVSAISPNAGVFQLDITKFSRDPQVVAACQNDPLVYQDGAPAHTAHELLGALDTIETRMHDVRVPLLVMHGGADEVTDPEGSRYLVARAETLDKTLHVWPGLVHDLVHEPEKAQVIGEIVAWIDKRAPPAKPAP
jgi:acylglycerol lipase